MNNFRLSFVFVGTIATLSGDQLTLTDGRHVTGSFLDGNARSIRFVTDSTVTTYAAGDVFTIRFGDAAEQTDSPSSGNILPAGLALTVKFQELVDSKHDAVGTDYRGTLVYGLPTGQAPLVPAGAEVGLRLVNDDASGPINGRNVLTMAIVSITVNGKPYNVSTVRMAKPSAPPAAKWTSLSAIALAPVAAIGERVRVPAQTILMFTLAEPLTIQRP